MPHSATTTPQQHARPRAHATHTVSNQATPLEGHNLFEQNRPLAEALEREGAGWARERAAALGARCGEPRVLGLGPLANENPPRLRTHDRFGHRIDEVEFHPAWHELMQLSVSEGLHSLPWTAPAGGHAARAALFMTVSQVEAGHGCPISMTYSAVPALRHTPALASEWEPLLTANSYVPGLERSAAAKGAALAGMGMTEKQGGSDVRANTTRAEPVNGGGAGGEYLLTGHKWFCSAPMCDVFLMLAQTAEGLSCFLVPRVLPDGERNVFRLQRLKDKLGNRSNASAEVELDGTWARMVGEPGRGVPTIIEMVGHTRLDCTIGAAAGMRAGVAHATHHAAHRSAFGRPLIEQPLMLAVLADLCVESEAATLTAMRLARAYDEGDEALRRLGTAVAKYWLCKRLPGHTAEALECLGGNGYIEESGMPRLFRESPLNGIWEGSGNVIALDVLRALAKSPRALEAFLAEVEEARGADPRLDAHVAELRRELRDLEAIEPRARRVVERMALALQGSLMVRHGDPAAADAFCAARLAGDAGLAYGTLPPGSDFRRIVERHRPLV